MTVSILVKLAGITGSEFRGGDLMGVTQQIEAGYFDKLGVKALWLSPFAMQPATAHLDQSGKYRVAAYHGYWPTLARKVDDRIGGDDALQRWYKRLTVTASGC